MIPPANEVLRLTGEEDSEKEPSAELLDLLREIRDGQREQLSLCRVSMEKDDQRYREWRQEQDEYKARVRQDEPRAARLDEANQLWMQQHQRWLRQQHLSRRVGLALLALLLLGGIVAAVLAAMGWFQ
jgi:hypothetical protein